MKCCQHCHGPLSEGRNVIELACYLKGYHVVCYVKTHKEDLMHNWIPYDFTCDCGQKWASVQVRDKATPQKCPICQAEVTGQAGSYEGKAVEKKEKQPRQEEWQRQD